MLTDISSGFLMRLGMLFEWDASFINAKLSLSLWYGGVPDTPNPDSLLGAIKSGEFLWIIKS